MSVARFILPLTLSAGSSGLLRCSVLSSTSSMHSLYSFYTSSSSTTSSTHRRNLQTATAYHPINLVESGVPPPRNADAPSSSLTGQGRSPASPVSNGVAPQTPIKKESVLTSPTPTPTLRPSRLRQPRKAAMTLTPSAVTRLRGLLASPDPKLIRVGVKNRGCSGLAYNLEYVDKPGKFDEEVVQEDVRVLIDSKALFSIIGSEMDWVEDKLSARFVFKNPNISMYSLWVVHVNGLQLNLVYRGSMWLRGEFQRRGLNRSAVPENSENSYDESIAPVRMNDCSLARYCHFYLLLPNLSKPKADD